MRERGVACGIHYADPCHRMPAFADGSVLPETEAACAGVLSLPIFVGLEEDEVDRVIAAANG